MSETQEEPVVAAEGEQVEEEVVAADEAVAATITEVASKCLPTDTACLEAEEERRKYEELQARNA
jgi:hypothetical protein